MLGDRHLLPHRAREVSIQVFFCSLSLLVQDEERVRPLV